MHILIFTLSFFIFLHTLYGLVKDDHVFLRKNIKLEEIFDIAFIVAIVGLISWQFISFKDNSALTFFVLASSVILFVIGKYKKFPLGRFFDFFTLSFLTSLPAVYVLESLFLKKIEFIIYLVSAGVYFLLAIFFNKVLLRKIMSRSLREGSLSIYFMMFFSSFSLVAEIVRTVTAQAGFLSFGNFILIFFFISSLVLFFVQKKN